MSDFINTIDVLGDDAVIDSIINRSIVEFKDDVITSVGNYAFNDCTALETIDLPNVTYLGTYAFRNCKALKMLDFPNIVEVGAYVQTIGDCGEGEAHIKLPRVTKIGTFGFRDFAPFIAEFSSAVTFANNAFGTSYRGCGYLILRSDAMSVMSGTAIFASDIKNAILVPRSLIDSYKVATNWSAYADKFKAIEDYTVDGTTTGELDKTKI